MCEFYFFKFPSPFQTNCRLLYFIFNKMCLKTMLTTEMQKKNVELMSTCAATERNAESHMQQLAARTESAIDTAQTRLLYADGRIGYHAQFVQVCSEM